MFWGVVLYLSLLLKMGLLKWLIFMLSLLYMLSFNILQLLNSVDNRLLLHRMNNRLFCRRCNMLNILYMIMLDRRGLIMFNFLYVLNFFYMLHLNILHYMFDLLNIFYFLLVL